MPFTVAFVWRLSITFRRSPDPSWPGRIRTLSHSADVAAAEALVLAMKAGLDPSITLKVLTDGAGSSRMLQVRGPMMVRGDYSKPTMKLDVWQKDMRIIDDFARQVGSPAPLFRATVPIYAAARAGGRGGEDTGAVCAVLENMAKYRRRGRASRKG